MHSPPDNVTIALCFLGFRSFIQIVLSRCLMDGLSETYREYSLAPTDNLIRFRMSKVKVTAGRRVGEGILVDAEASKSISWFSSGSLCSVSFATKVHKGWSSLQFWYATYIACTWTGRVVWGRSGTVGASFGFYLREAFQSLTHAEKT